MEESSGRKKFPPVENGITPKVFGKGSSCPPTTPGRMRLYNMRFCPYAERVVLVLEAKKIPHEVVNVNLTEKPEWYFEKHPEGKVPAIEIDGQVIAESLILCDYLEDAFPNPSLYSNDPFKKAKDKMLMVAFSKVESKLLPLLKLSADDYKAAFENVMSELDYYERELELRDTKYFQGSKPGMVDYAIWPWFERIRSFPELVKTGPLPKDRFPLLTTWIESMVGHPVVNKVAFPPETITKYFNSKLGGATPDYDLAL